MPLIAVLGSWEDRFGAPLIDVGFAGPRLLVERPPRALEAAQRIAPSRSYSPMTGSPGQGMCTT